MTAEQNRPPTDTTFSADLHDLLELAGKVDDRGLSSSDEEVSVGDVLLHQTTDLISIDQMAIPPRESDIWPGNLFNMADLENPVQLTVPRAPMVLSIGGLETSISTPEGSKSIIVESPRKSSVRDDISTLVKRVIDSGTSFVADAGVDVTDVHSEEDVKVALSAGVKYGGFSGSVDFDWSSSSVRSRLLATYRQRYYTIDVDQPELPWGLFADGADLEKIRPRLPAGSRPAYVSSITYGVVAYTLVESESDEATIKAALKASYKGVADVEASLSTEHRTALEKSRMRTIVVGGSTRNLGEIFEGYEGFRDVLQASMGDEASSPPAPIEFRLTNVLDGSRARIDLARRRQTIRVQVTAEQLKLTRRNEGIRMDRFFLWATTAGSQEETVYEWYDPNYQGMGVGATHVCKERHRPFDKVFELDVPNKCLDSLELRMRGAARDWGPGSAKDHWAEGTDLVRGAAIFDTHHFTLSTGQCDFEVTYSVKAI